MDTSDLHIINCDFKEILLAVLIFLACQPVFVWNYGITYALSSALIFVFFFNRVDTKRNGNIFFLFVFCSAYLLLPILRSSNIATVLMYLAFAIIPCLDSKIIKGAYDYFRVLLIITFSLSIITLILIFIGVPLSYSVIEPINQLKQYSYIYYPFLLIPTYVEDGSFARFCSVFDEPGAVGTLAGLILSVENYNIKRYGNLIIFAAGCLSASLYFVVISFAYMFFFYQGKSKYYFVLFILLLYLITKDIDVFQRLVWDRIALSNSGKFQGDSRNTEEILKAFDELKYDFRILFGMGANYVDKIAGGSASIQVFILRDGFVFVLLFLCGYILMALRYIKNRKSLLFFVSFVLIGTLYQRPGFCNPDFLFLFTAFIFFHDESREDVNIGCSGLL